LSTDQALTGGTEPPSPESPRPGPGRRSWLLLVLLLLLHAVFVWLARRPGILTGQGDVQYIVLGQSIRDGGYRDAFLAHAPPHAQYPPGYPAVVAVWGAVFGDSFDSLAALSLLFSLTSLFLVYLAARRVFDERFALWTLLALCVNPVLIVFGGAIASETPYLLASTLALYALARDRPSGRWLALAIAASILATLTRSVGVTLIGAIALHWVLEERWRPALVLAGASALLVGAWLLWTLVSPASAVGSAYVAELRAAAAGQPWRLPIHERIFDHALWYVRAAIPSSLAVPTVSGTWIDNLLSVALLLVAGIAGMVSLIRVWRPAALYLIAYAALLALWLWSVDRFVAPVVPLLIVTILSGARVLARPLHANGAAIAVAAFALVFAGSGVVRSFAAVRDHVRCQRGGDMPDPQCLSVDQASYFDALRWIRANTPDDAIFLAAKSGALYHYTGRTSTAWADGVSQQRANFLPWLRQRRARRILASGLDVREPSALAPLLVANCRGLVSAAEFPPRTFLFELRDRVSDAEADASCAAAARYRDLHPLRGEQPLR